VSSRRGRIGVAWEVRDRSPSARPLTDRAVREAVRAALVFGGRPGIDVEVALVGDRKLASIHGRFLGSNATTDVISFDLGAEGGGPSAEIYVSVDRARRVATELEIEPATELRLYLVHGALHLCGFDDHATIDRRRMRVAEAAVLALLAAPGARNRRTRDPRPYRKTGKSSRR